jgi:hypothetical protein
MTLRVRPPVIAWHAGAAFVAAGVAVWSLTAFIDKYEGAPCFAGYQFYILPALFSMSVIWLLSEAIQTTSAAVLERPIGRMRALALAIAAHFLIGTVLFFIFPNAAGQDGAQSGEAVWIPMWIQGVLYQADHLRVCH